jgi:hypothetical protein
LAYFATMNITINQLVPVLQLAIGPVILISGVGLLLLSFTNRLGRLIDRSRLLHREQLSGPAPEQQGLLRVQIELIDRRSGILRQAISLAGLTVLLVSVLILVLFIAALFQLELGVVIVCLFALALLALIGSIIGFLREITLSLEAVRLETQHGAKAAG